MTVVTNNPTGARFELSENGHTAWADYRRAPGLLIIDHVEAPTALRGTGASGRLMEGVAAQAREGQLKIVANCSYAAAWLQRSGNDRDLLA